MTFVLYDTHTFGQGTFIFVTIQLKLKRWLCELARLKGKRLGLISQFRRIFTASTWAISSASLTAVK